MTEVQATKSKAPVKVDMKSKLEELRVKHNELVRGMFKFYEVPGGVLSFDFLEFKGDPVRHYDLKDGEIVRIPLGVAKHLNKNGWYPIHSHEMDAAGKSVQRIGEKKRRFGFHSMEFQDEVDIEEEKGRIVTVERVF